MPFVKRRELPKNPDVEGERCELPGEVAGVRGPEAESEVVADSIGSLLKRVAGSSVQEIDRVLAELESLRNLLQSEGARVQREIAEYAHLSQSAMQTTNVIAETIAKLKTDPSNLDGGDEAKLLWGQESCRAATGLRPDGGAVSLVPQDGEPRRMEPPSRAKSPAI
jgi:hypothetical protein